MLKMGISHTEFLISGSSPVKRFQDTKQRLGIFSVKWTFQLHTNQKRKIPKLRVTLQSTIEHLEITKEEKRNDGFYMLYANSEFRSLTELRQKMSEISYSWTFHPYPGFSAFSQRGQIRLVGISFVSLFTLESEA